MKIKNVVIVNDRNYIEGGSDKIAIYTAQELIKKRIRVIFFSAENIYKSEIHGVQYVYTKQKEALKEKNKLKGIINGIYNFKAKRKLKDILNKLSPEDTIIHIHGWTKALSSSVFDIAFKMKFKVVLTMHDYFTACPNGGYFNYKQNEICHLKPLSCKCVKCNCDSRNYGFKLYRIVKQFVQNKIVRLNDRLEYAITISEFSEKILKNTLGKNTKVTRIYNPIDIPKKIEKSNIRKDYFLYVGRVTQEKGVEIFCKAITDVNKTGIVVGEGRELERLRKEYPNITFVGWKNSTEVVKYIEESEALIFPSIWYETAGLTVLEAQKLGIPCIVNRNTAASEFLEYGNLYSDYEELKKCLQEKKYYKVNKTYREEDYITQLIEYFEKIIVEK